MKSLEFTFLMPCLNEEETLAICIRKAHQGAQAAGLTSYEVLIADNGSSDGSQEIAVREGARVIDVPQRGYGAALIAGIENAYGTYVIMADADDSYDWSTLQPFFEKLRGGYSLVMGTRLRGTIKPGAMPFLHRWVGNPILTFIGNLLFKANVSDYHCGLRGFDRQAIQKLNLHTKGMEFATEMVTKAALARLKITEVPIIYSPDGRSRLPHLRTWRDGWRHLSFMLVMSPTWLFLIPSVLLILLGLVTNILLLPGALQIGTVTFDIHTLLIGSMSFILGIELIMFWLVARTYAVSTGLLEPPAPLASFSLNNSLLIGVFLTLISFIPLLHALQLWSNVEFGALNYQIALRSLIPGLTLAVTGLQIVFGSFVLALIRLRDG